MNKKVILILLILMSILAISQVSAADDTAGDNITDVDAQIIDASFEDEVVNDVDTKEVDELANEEMGSLIIQEKINQAPENGTVTLDGSTYNCDIPVHVNKTLIIDGNGSTLKFDGEGKQQNFSFFSVNSIASNVVLKNMKFIGGHYFYGGAISWGGDNGSIINCEFIDNLAQGEYGIAGAILVLGDNCNITNCTFKDNIANVYGGAVLINATGATIRDCVFSNNFANGIAEDEDDIFGGGALVLISNDCLVINSNFTVNHATEAGGAISIFANINNTIKNCRFEGNYITGNNSGGAIYTACLGATIDNCSFIGNNASNSICGAISLSDRDILINSFFKDNHAITDESGYAFGNDIGYFGTFSNYTNNIRGNTFILDYLEEEQYAVGVNDDNELFRTILENNIFKKTKLNSTIQFYPLSGIIFDYGGISNSITISIDEGGIIEEKNIRVLNHPEAKISYSNDNVLSVSGLNVGNYILRVTTTPDEWHNEAIGELGITVNKATAVISAEKQTFAYKKSSLWSIKLVDSSNKKPIANMKLTLKVYTGSKYKTVTVKTNSKGIATYQAKGLSAGNHKIVVSASHGQYKFNTLTSSIKVVKQTALKFKVKKSTRKDGASLSITVKNKKTKKAMNGVKIKLMIYNGKKLVKTVTLKTMKKGKFKGVCGYATNKLTVGTHKVKIVPVDIKYSGSASSTMKITKKAKKKPDWEAKDTAK